KGYRHACGKVLEKWGQTGSFSVANSIAWTCALDPESVADFKPVWRLAEMVASDKNLLPRLNTLGAVLYRAGRYEEPVKRLKESVAKSPAKKGSAWDWLFLAMAHQKLGHMEEATNCLTKAAELKKAKDLPWTQRLESQILHKEALPVLGAGDSVFRGFLG